MRISDGAWPGSWEHVLTFTLSLSPGSSGASSRDLRSNLPRAGLPGTTGGGKIISASGITAFNPSPSLALRPLPPTCFGGVSFLVHLIPRWEFSDDVITLVRMGRAGLAAVAICWPPGGLHRSAEEEEEEE